MIRTISSDDDNAITRIELLEYMLKKLDLVSQQVRLDAMT